MGHLSLSSEYLLAAAKRSVLLGCSPINLPGVLRLFQRNCGPISNSYYWMDRDRPGVLLLEAESEKNLKFGLLRMSQYPKSSQLLYGCSTTSGPPLPAFRITSDHSQWSSLVNTDGRCQSNGVHHDRWWLDRMCKICPTFQLQRKRITTQVLTNCLSNCNSIDEQARVLFDKTHATNAELLARFVISDSLEELLFYFRSGTTVRPFGSAVNGWGTSTSDLDLVIDLGSEPQPYFTEWSCPISSSILNIPKKMIGMGQLSAASLASFLLNTNDQLRPRFLSILRHLLKRLDSVGFRSTKVYPGRIPILHLPKSQLLGVGVDISCIFNKCHGLRHDDFHDGLQMATCIRLFDHYVPGLNSCIAAIKFIANRSDLTKSGPQPGWTNFKLTMLFVHFLQVSGYAPSLERMILNSDSFVHGQNFLPRFPDIPPLPPLEQLLIQFFEYIPTLNPMHYILCLQSGCILPRNHSSIQRIHRSSCLPDECHDDDEQPIDLSVTVNNFIICPNPVRPCQNILRGVTEEKWDEFMQLCAYWHESLVHDNDQGKIQKNWGLLNLQKQGSTSPQLITNDASIQPSCSSSNPVALPHTM